MLYKEWLNEWLEVYVRASAKERTYKKYRQQVRKYIVPSLGEYDTDGLSAGVLQRFSLSLAGLGLSANTANGILTLLKSSLTKAVALGLAQGHFCEAIVRPKTRAGKVGCFSKAEQLLIEKYVFEHNTPYLFGILLGLYCGLRIGELLALTWEDVDFERGTLNITKTCRDSWQGGSYVKLLDTTKTPSSERLVPLPSGIMAHLRTLKQAAKCPFVVTGRTPYGAEVRSYQRTFAAVLKNLGLPHRGFHSLRHTFATRALEVGMDIKTLAEILGHKNATVTLQRYAHSLLEHKQEMMNRVGQLLQY